MTTPCCGCHFVSDYGTSIVTGDGSTIDPFSVTQVDPLFNRPVVRTILRSDRVIPNNTPTAVQWDDVLFDSNGMFNVANNTRLTIVVAGIYAMGYHMVWPGSAVGAYKSQMFRLDGATDLHSATRLDTGAFTQNQSGEYVWYFEAGQYVELVLTQASGGPVTIPGTPEFDSAGLGLSGMWMIYLGKKI